jgi:hypothetical protein
MPFEKFVDLETINKERRKAIAKSIRIISVEELMKLGEEIFDDPRSALARNVQSIGRGKSGLHLLPCVRRRRRHFSLLPRQRQRVVVSAWERYRAIVGGGSATDKGSGRGRPLNTA